MKRSPKLLFKCDVCDKSYKSDEVRSTHMLFVHNILRPRCENYNLIKNRIEAEDRLVTDYRNQFRYLNRELVTYNKTVIIEEFYKLIALESKLLAYKMNVWADSFYKVKEYAKTLYKKEHGTNIPLDYKIKYRDINTIHCGTFTYVSSIGVFEVTIDKERHGHSRSSREILRY